MAQKLEDLIIDVLIIAVIGLAAMAILKVFNPSFGSGLSDFWSQIRNLFGGSSDDDSGPSTTWLSPQGSGIPSQPLPAATPQQIADVQNGIDNFEQFANSSVPWQDQGFDWFAQQFTGQSTTVPDYLQPW